MKRTPKVKTVVAALWLAGSPGRKHLAGILRYVNSGHPWNLKLITEPDSFDAAAIAQAEKDGVDGFIVCVNARTAPALAQSKIPTVLMDFPPPAMFRRQRSLTMMFNDEESIGRTGARYLNSLGNFACYAFVPDEENRGWSRLRERGFKDHFTRQGIDCRVYDRRKTDLDKWLAELPKPAAVMAAFDFRANDVLAACRRQKLPVPGQVCVLGVDNDDILCEYSSPTLSSIRIDHEKNGYDSAAQLDRLMRSRKVRGVEKVFKPAGNVVERESTRPISPLTVLVRKAKAFIDSHATEGIGVADVVAHLGVSRRLADLRFSQATGLSIRRAIEDRRLLEVQRRLTKTGMSIASVSRLCGYDNVQRLKYVFRKRYGVSMREWRAAHARISASGSDGSTPPLRRKGRTRP